MIERNSVKIESGINSSWKLPNVKRQMYCDVAGLRGAADSCHMTLFFFVEGNSPSFIALSSRYLEDILSTFHLRYLELG
jgi:hypothetical protein